jgi:hypothetical protein
MDRAKLERAVLEQLWLATDNEVDNVTLDVDGQQHGLQFTVHDSFLTVSFEGDSETFEIENNSPAKAVHDAVETASVMLDEASITL